MQAFRRVLTIPALGSGRVNPGPAPETDMPRGDKSSYTDKQKRQAHHIEESEKKEGKSSEAAERIGWATVNKQDHGGKKSSSSKHH
jgi:hypothetical protein